MTDQETRATHLAHINIWNDAGEYEYWYEMAKECLDDNGELNTDTASYDLSKLMKEHYEEHNPCADYQMVYSDLMGWALACVDWYDIAEGFIEHINE